ncbi:MAG: four helix bundle protein [Gemmatimonadales bacterium]|nr:four helix bundle protein [Gemmatimonadales bacterium]
MNSYEKLHAWKAAHDLVLLVYRATRTFPTEERYGLTSQLRRAAFGVAANIAEGSAKKGPREFRRFLDIAVASMAELTYTLRLAQDLELIAEALQVELEKQRDLTSRLTWRLYAAVRRLATRTG